jgi:hypothetical protein
MQHRLMDRTKSCLVVIDVQHCFLDKLPADWRHPLVALIAWLMRVANVLDIPIIGQVLHFVIPALVAGTHGAKAHRLRVC